MKTDQSVSDFLAKFQRGFASPNRYRVEFSLPSGVKALTAGMIGVNADALAKNMPGMNSFFNSNNQVNIACHTMTMPQRSLMTYEIKQNSAPVRYPYSATYDPVTFSFYVNSDYNTRDFFEVWQSSVVNFSTNTINFPDEYVSNVKMYAQDTHGQDTYGVTLENAYPLNIGIVDFSYSQMNAFQTITVTMSYKWWYPTAYREVGA